jgi:hypothetical protein
VRADDVESLEADAAGGAKDSKAAPHAVERT